MTSFSFQRCIQAGRCSAQEQQAATLDYISFVYGPNIAEKIKKEAVPAGDEPTDFYLSEAKRLLFLQHGVRGNNATICDEEKYDFSAGQPKPLLQHYTSSNFGHGVFLGVYHGCFNQFAERFQSVERDVAAQPDAWLFLVEGISNKGENESAVAYGEHLLFGQIANRLHIPIEEAILGPSHRSNQVAMQEEHGITPQKFALEYLIAHVYETCVVAGSEEEQISALEQILQNDAIVQRSIQMLSENFAVDAQQLFSDYLLSFANPLRQLGKKMWPLYSPGEVMFFYARLCGQQAGQWVEKNNKIIAELSVEQIHENIHRHRKPHVFVQTGIFHQDLVQEAFK